MSKVLFLLNSFPLHPDINPIIKDLYYNTFPRPHGCYIINETCYFHNMGDKYYKKLPLNNKTKLVYGDIIIIRFYNYKGNIDIKYFYNGTQNLVQINNNTSDYTCFKIITNNVPINYWSNVFNGVSFDHTPIKDQCVNNISFGLVMEYAPLANGLKRYYAIERYYGVYTTFIYNNINYRIIYNFSKRSSELFKKYLYTNQRKWDNIKKDFISNLHKNICSFYVPPKELDDGYTLVLNNTL